LGKLGDQKVRKTNQEMDRLRVSRPFVFHLYKHDDDSATEALRTLGALSSVIAENN